ncbi:FtsK/SpoIIIE domain-containing protein [Alkalihalophilus pseudofirmus]|uniref:FtsK/SpoIIIE domain-containing protein n=1 Tax=Alkalihalophilus pseudofirmus TaxID=79885 RepID=UPI00259BE982|nr:FtsK/SpoIIIE domain-containing protein [Alkalihalophilus pseudofirmus]WEG18530.1 FtsK/SpoIIIE domain-containing protein [Alkalihalophilus pseudofirmus]
MIKRILESFHDSDEERYQYQDFLLKDFERVLENNYLELSYVTALWKFTQDENKCYLHAPNFWKKRGYKPVTNGVSVKASRWYRLGLIKDSFYPIGVGEGFSFISSLLGNKHLLSGDDEIILKINLKKRVGGWRSEELEKYQHFLNGNALAVENKTVRKFAQLLKRGEDANDNIYTNLEDIEQKIISDQFQFECLIGVTSESNDQLKTLLSLINKCVNDLAGLNRFDLVRATNHSEPFYNKEYLCKQEILSLTSVNDSYEITNDLIPQAPVVSGSYVSESTSDSIFELLPRIEVTNDSNEHSDISKRIIAALKRVGVIKGKGMKLDSELSGLSFIRCQYTIPENLVFTKIFEKNKDLRVALGVPSLTIEQGDKPDTIAFLIPKEDRKPLYLGNILSSPSNLSSLSKLDIPFFIGLDPLGEPIFMCLSDIKHLLVAGQTGGGKSVWLNQAILTMLLMMTPEELELYLIDPKKVEFSQFKQFEQVKIVETDAEKSVSILANLINIMEERYELLSNANAKSLKDYNAKSNNKLPYIVVVVDEFADLRMSNKVVVEHIASLSQKARGAGIHLIIATQRPDVKIIDGFIKDNLPSKICFRLGSNKAYSTVFGTGIPFELLGKGHGAMKIEGQLKEFEQFQSAAISLDSKEEEKAYERIANYLKRNGHKKESIVDTDESIEQESDLDRLKKIIASTGETRVTTLRKELGIRGDKVQELMQELVVEGWLHKHESRNKGYELIAIDEELDKWRE